MYCFGGRDIQAIIFDMDGTIFDSERIFYDIWELAEREFGFRGKDDLFRLFTGVPGGKTLEILNNYFGDMELALRVKEFQTREIQRLLQEYGTRFQPGAKELLEYVWNNKKIPTAMATSSAPPRVKRQFQEANFTPRFEVVVTGDQVKRGKPEPDIFLLAASQLGVPIEHCLVVEDSPSGIKAAANSGAYAILIPDIMQPDEEMLSQADEVYPALTDILEELKRQDQQ